MNATTSSTESTAGDVANTDTTTAAEAVQNAMLFSMKQQAIPGQTDTLVMQTLGYFQLQANPGVYLLNLAAGRATEIFSIVRKDDINPSSNGRHHGMFVAVRSFGDVVKQLMVTKRPGMESVPLLPAEGDDEQDDLEASMSGGGMWSSLTSTLFGSDKANKKQKKVARADEDDDGLIHVFSLATGHLYERFLRIMMLSVSRQTSKKVKFWLFENYLSPTFKQIAEEMSKEYGFEVKNKNCVLFLFFMFIFHIYL